MAYDEIRKRVILCAGVESTGLFAKPDTWEWDGEDWTQVADTGPIEPIGMAHDSLRNRTIVLAGGNAGPIHQTWEWDGEYWTQVADTGPSTRLLSAMAFDKGRGRIVLFGGHRGTDLADTWEWDGNEWTQQGETGPPPRRHHAMAYHAGSERVVIYGGLVDPNPGNLLRYSDTWEWDGSLWKKVADTGPGPRSETAMVSFRNFVWLFGGACGKPASPKNDTWQWDGKHWTQRQDLGPSPRSFHAMATDADRERVVLFGGNPASPLGDTWEAFEKAQVG